jgi:hypothetical protein
LTVRGRATVCAIAALAWPATARAQGAIARVAVDTTADFGAAESGDGATGVVMDAVATASLGRVDHAATASLVWWRRWR